MEIRDLNELSGGEKVVIEKNGRVFLIQGDEVKETEQSASDEEGIARCVSQETEDYFYIGTVADNILKVNEDGEILKEIDGAGLTSFNSIYEFEDGKFWVCSDTGIGILQDDVVTKLNFPLNDSVEEVCTDYQGSYWFASSRQGVMQLYESGFSDLGAYWGMKETVNSIQYYHDRIYVGCDSGLYCYQGKEPMEDALTEACRGIRIRQIYKDEEDNLWVSTYQDGIKEFRSTGELVDYHMQNSSLETNQIRCIWQEHTGRILIGTEKGLFVMDQNGEIQRLVEDENLNSRRILDVTDYDGSIYAATDGYGVYEIKDDKITAVYSRKPGLPSGVVMKVVPSDQMKGIWLVTGEEVCFLDQERNIRKVTGNDIANSLDLLLTEDREAVIIAGNGIFRAKEEELLEENTSYRKLNRRDGLPIDFTANAGNMIQDGILYLCGTTGAASMDLREDRARREVRTYLNAITADGEAADIQSDQIMLPVKTGRIDIDVRCIDFVHQNLWIAYQLEGVDPEPVFFQDDDEKEISYTNLSGGRYTYHYEVYDENAETVIAKMDVKFQKEYDLWEMPKIRKLLVYIGVAVLLLLNLIVLLLRERMMEKKYRIELRKAREEELEKLAYTDMATGAYNRNRFEMEKEKLNVKQVYAFLLVSVNYRDYVLNKYGHDIWGRILGRAVQSLKECTPEDTELYRVSDRVFAFWLKDAVNLEEYVTDLKKNFEQKSEEADIPLSFAVGAVYNNMVDNESIDNLMVRCEKIRLLDEKMQRRNSLKEK